MQRVPFFTAPSSAALTLLCLIVYRHWVAAGQLAAVLAASALGFSLPVWTLVMIIVAYTTINFFTAARLRRRTQPEGERELFLHLLTDTAVLAVLLYLSGGSTHPIVSLILLALARVVALRDERLVARGTLSAGAAHDLGTPLATIAVLAKDLQQERLGHR